MLSRADNLAAFNEVFMFVRHGPSVRLGDIFTAAPTSQNSLFKMHDAATAPPCDTSRWRVAAFVLFNDLPHAKLTHCETGRQRLIALDALKQGNIYRKIIQRKSG